MYKLVIMGVASVAFLVSGMNANAVAKEVWVLEYQDGNRLHRIATFNDSKSCAAERKRLKASYPSARCRKVPKV